MENMGMKSKFCDKTMTRTHGTSTGKRDTNLPTYKFLILS